MRAVVVLLILSIFSIFILSAFAEVDRSKLLDELFEKGARFRSIYVEYYDSEDSDRDIRIYCLNWEDGIYVFNNFALRGGGKVFTAAGERIWDDPPPFAKVESTDAFGVGINGGVHWDIISIGRNSLFVDWELGFQVSNREFPPGGTWWNFNRRLGWGTSIKANDRFNIIFGGRHMHISNGKGYGHPRNPSYDGDGGYIGVIYGF